MKHKPFGYGLSKPISEIGPAASNLPIEVHAFRKSLLKAYVVLIAFSVVLAFILPSNARGASGIFSAWVDFIQENIPYVHWIEENSRIPELASAWFAIMWPLLLMYLLYVIAIFPYRFAPVMVRQRPMSAWKWIKILLGLLLVSWMTYSIFYERRFATIKSATLGHGRLIEAVAIDSRFGLAILAPLLMSLCIFVWASTVVMLLAYVAQFFGIEEVTPLNGDSK
jgi:hypothetical protein